MRRVIAAAALFAACAAVVLPATATGAPECNYQSSSRTVEIDLSAGDPSTRVEVASDGRIRVGASNCGAASVTNTDVVNVIGTSRPDKFDISLRGGLFTGIVFRVNLAGGHDQLRVFGTTGPDRITVGTAGIDLDPNTHRGRDIKLSNVESVLINGLAGKDVLSGQGGGIDGGPTHIPLDLIGAGGNDHLTGGAANDILSGSDNTDVLDGKGGNDLLFGNKGSDTIRGGSGFDATFYQGRSTPVIVTEDGRPNDGSPSSGERDNVYPDVEKIVGGNAGDHLTGGPGPNVLIGGPGNDHLDGGGGRNRCNGGPGINHLVHC
jgi:Ca2+-binding RTX toxin-like protein